MSISIASVELVASPRPVPRNGSPDSSDFNAFQTEVLADLAEISDFLNESILPILQALPSAAATGLDGAGLYADLSKSDPLFRDNLGNSYTVSEVFSSLAATQAALKQQMTDLAARVLSLQSRLATTQQNDLRASVQALHDSYSSLVTKMSGILGDVALQGSILAKTRKVSVDIQPVSEAGNNVVDVTFDPPFADNTYVVTLALETSGGMSVQNFIKKDNGGGLVVNLLSDATSPSGILNILAQAF